MANEIIIERLKSARKKYGYTQKNVAEILKIKRSTYAKYENGQAVPPADIFIRLATMYGIHVDYLIGRDAYAKEIMSDSAADTEDKIKFFNYFMTMTEEQRNDTLRHMEELMNKEGSDAE
ncbi:MAG: helix-turn-helix transcriptional regulator [Ruminococcaceae bacterium]|nr:helix-turn-helix transcriptional regulator [Oscillospiraceae bacterium]